MGIVLAGYRAAGDHRSNSDVDLTIIALHDDNVEWTKIACSVIIHAGQMPPQKAKEKRCVSYLAGARPGARWYSGEPLQLRDGYITREGVTLNAGQFMQFLRRTKEAAQGQSIPRIEGDPGQDNGVNISQAIIAEIDGMPSADLLTCMKTLGELAEMLTGTAVATLVA